MIVNKLKIHLIFIFVFCCINISSSQKSLFELSIKNIDGKETNINELSMDKVVIVNFWATWCEPCLKELDAFNKNLQLIEQELNSKLILVSIDDSRTVSRITPMVHGNSWDFEVFLDTNQNIKRSLNIIDIPHTLLIYQNKIVYESTGYLIGDEEILFDKIRALNSE
jgi:cytochrome c biogenesis protein CcmG/thiol:disulfide interchange protein DsbE